MKKILVIVFIVVTASLIGWSQQTVDVRKISAPATGTQTAANSDSIVCATDTGCVVKQATATNLNAAVVGTGTAGTPAGGVLTIQGVTSMTKLLVTPDSVALPANQSVNVSQINGVTTLMGNGTTGTGSQRVTIASDNSPITGMAVSTQGSSSTTNMVMQGAVSATAAQQDIVCGQSVMFDGTTTGSSQLVALSGSTHVYVCGYEMIAGGTVNVKLIAGTGSNCGSAISGATNVTRVGGVAGDLTPAWQLTAQAGHVVPMPTHGYLFDAGAGNALCVNLNGSVQAEVQVWYQQR